MVWNVFGKKGREKGTDIYVRQDKVYRNIVKIAMVGGIARKEAGTLEENINIQITGCGKKGLVTNDFSNTYHGRCISR